MIKMLTGILPKELQLMLQSPTEIAKVGHCGCCHLHLFVGGSLPLPGVSTQMAAKGVGDLTCLSSCSQWATDLIRVDIYSSSSLLGGKRGVLHWSLKVPWRIRHCYPQRSATWLLFTSFFLSLLQLPAPLQVFLESPAKETLLHSNLCLRICFQENPN